MNRNCAIFQEEDSISHLLFYCRHVRPFWEVVIDVLLPGQTVSHYMIIFWYSTDRVLNHVFSLTKYFIHTEWLVYALWMQHIYKSLVNCLSIRNVFTPSAVIQIGQIHSLNWKFWYHILKRICACNKYCTEWVTYHMWSVIGLWPFHCISILLFNIQSWT